jgi:hypothetical protein
MRLLFSPLTLISDSVSCHYHFSVAADVSTLSPDPVARDAKPLEAPMPSTADHDVEPVEALDRWRPGSSRRLDPVPDARGYHACHHIGAASIDPASRGHQWQM